ncbi:unnamed protein product [Paramecium sonneborni]|uniref:Transmembrane protein n=1 Tax=Paramecium sonneborni TaxID=65129 RepID=A0A8S1Q9D7_9CILI|nr:unnamed protein product [Paramecium sonneborni]
MQEVIETEPAQTPFVVTEKDINEQGIFSQTSKALGWYQYFPESPIVASQQLSHHDQQMLFIVKLYAFLAFLFIIQYLMVIIFYYSFNFRESLIEYQKFGHYQEYNYTTLYWVFLALTIILGLVAYIIKQTRRYPTNLILYFLYTFGIGCVLGAPYAAQLYYNNHSLMIILYQFCMTICTFGSLIAYKFKDSEFMNASYFLLIAIILDVFIVFIFIIIYIDYVWLIIVSIILHVIYAALLLFEIRLIQRGKFNLRQDEYISGALLIYLEVTIFLFFLVLFFFIFLCVAFLVMIGFLIVNRK